MGRGGCNDMKRHEYEHTDSSPCEFCVPPKRHSGCHDTCGEYKAYRCGLDRNRELIIKAKQKENAFVAYKKDGISKELKRRRK
jgi:hypothetical protein